VDAPDAIPESNPDNNALPRNVSIVATKGLVLPHVRIPFCSRGVCYGPLASIHEHAEQSGAFIQAVFPVPDGSVETPVAFYSLAGTPQPGSQAVVMDATRIYATALLTDPGAKRGVGVVPSDYFSYHGYPSCTNPNGDPWVWGVTFSGIAGVFSPNDPWTAIGP
jgi:hypothetical protein